MKNVLPNLFSYIYQVISSYLKLSLATDFISGCGAFSFNSQSVKVFLAYLLLELLCSVLLAKSWDLQQVPFGIWCHPCVSSYLLLALAVSSYP